MVSIKTHRRRGVLLLVVLSVLTLFLMLGATYLAVATRARKASRAFADNVVAATTARATETRLLDEVFMTVARGTTVPLTSGTALAGGDDLLGDKYGINSIRGRLLSASFFSTSPGFIQLSGTALGLVGSGSITPSNSAELVGRVVTINLPGLSASTRILSATGSWTSPTLVIPAGPTPAGTVLSLAKINAGLAMLSGTSTTTLVINGREFDGSSTNEPYDGFDDRNPLLTRLTPNTGGSPTVTAAQLSGTAPLNSSNAVDNDGDGILDSAWLNIGLQPIINASGQSLRPEAAILVVDLDGRLNVNAHGSNADQEAFDPGTGADRYPTYTTGSHRPAVPLYHLPRGISSGPATVSLSRSLLFSDTTSEQTVVEGGLRVLGGRQAGQRKSADANGREVPIVRNIEGRYGDSSWAGSFTAIAQPGISGSNDRISLDADVWRATLSSGSAQSFFAAPGRFGSPWDVKGRMSLWVDGSGQPVYYKPSWSIAGSVNDVVDDAYEINLTRSGVRNAYTAAPSASSPPVDNLYTPAELEGLLRYNDPDSLKLPRRLLALNEDQADRNRLLVTTESWDTPAITGTTWQQTISASFSALLTSATTTFPKRAQDLFAPEILMGHKMDLNRPFHDSPNFSEPNDATGITRRQAFAKQLYCLMMAVAQRNGLTTSGSTARQIAQYAINVVDYRDGDSIMTKFEFDPNFSGTNTTWTTGSNNYVWGCERPELLITETLAWHNRRTDDDDVGKLIVETDDYLIADKHLDQVRRPWGAFFVELYSPWQSNAATYTTTSGTPNCTLTLPSSGTTSRAEPVPATLTASGSGGFSASATISLRKVNSYGCPTWRLVSVRGQKRPGGAFTSNGEILDPAIPSTSGTAHVDRVFYFTRPLMPQLLSGSDSGDPNGFGGAVFWASGTLAAPEPSPSRRVVVGTLGPLFSPGQVSSSPNPDLDIGFDQSLNSIPAKSNNPNDRARTPATLSEPICIKSGTNTDPYEVIAGSLHSRPGQVKFIPDNNAQPHQYTDDVRLQNNDRTDMPLDAYQTAPTGISDPFLVDDESPLAATALGKPLLMINGDHANFAVVYLQRLANPELEWDAATNPYLTVDSMPVDLTVINTQRSAKSDGPIGPNVDEPGQTPLEINAGKAVPGPDALAWLQQRLPYKGTGGTKTESTERGGKKGSNIPTERDIWSRRVRVDSANASDGLLPAVTAPESFRTKAMVPVNSRTLLNMQGITQTPKTAPQIDNSQTAPPLDNSTLTDGQLVDSLPSRFARDEDLNGNNVIDTTPIDEDTNANKRLDAPNYVWLAWLNRPFSSVIDLTLVPTTSPFDLTGKHSIRTTGTASPDFNHLPRFFEPTAPPQPWLALAGGTNAAGPHIMDFVHVPSPFAGIYATAPLSSNTSALTALGLNFYPVNNLSSFREPGKVNVNTITDQRVWRALFGDVRAQGDPIAPNPDFRDKLPGWSATLFTQPMASGTTGSQGESAAAASALAIFRNLPDRGSNNRPAAARVGGFTDNFVSEDTNNNNVLDPGEDDNANGLLDINHHRNTDRNAYFRYQTMRQLSNVVTTRSNVYAAWITIRYVDSAGNEVTPVRRSRAFYIFDRSIPVAYERGQDHNVRDAILLRRIIQ